MKLETGLTVADRYRLDRKIGVGGMGEVWSATQTLTRKPVALKFLLPDPKAAEGTQSRADAKQRLVREARAACAVRHPNVVQIHDVLQLEDGSPVMVMELLEGESLEDRLQGGPLALGDLAAVMLRVVSAVGTAHALGIIHRDLKPDNVYLAQTSDGVQVKVLDFGIAKLTAVDGDAAATGGLTRTGAMMGTPYYMSPEQAFGEKNIDHRADIWSLGVMLYRCLSGVLPTEADNIGQILKIIMTHAIPPLQQVAPQVPADLAALVNRMLEADVGRRVHDLNEVRDVLSQYAGVEVEAFDAPAAHPARLASVGGVTGDPSSVTASGVEPKKRGALPFVVGGAALAAVVVVAGVMASNEPVAITPAVAPSASPIASAAAAMAPASAVALPEPSVAPVPSNAPAAVSNKMTTSRGARPAAVASAAAAPAAEPKKSLGGVIEKPNF